MRKPDGQLDYYDNPNDITIHIPGKLCNKNIFLFKKRDVWTCPVCEYNTNPGELLKSDKNFNFVECPECKSKIKRWRY